MKHAITAALFPCSIFLLAFIISTGQSQYLYPSYGYGYPGGSPYYSPYSWSGGYSPYYGYGYPMQGMYGAGYGYPMYGGGYGYPMYAGPRIQR